MTHALETIQNRIKDTLDRIVHGMPAEKVFAAVYHQGDVINPTLLPAAAIIFDEDDVLELTAKTKITAPFDILVNFQIEDGREPREMHALLLAKIQTALHANRTLKDNTGSSSAIDLRYTGGGCRLEPLSDENPCGLWGFVAEFEVDFRYLTANPAAIA